MHIKIPLSRYEVRDGQISELLLDILGTHLHSLGFAADRRYGNRTKHAE